MMLLVVSVITPTDIIALADERFSSLLPGCGWQRRRSTGAACLHDACLTSFSVSLVVFVRAAMDLIQLHAGSPA